jgi:hypothetical protein
VEQHVNLAGLPVEAVLLIADGADGAAGSRPEARRIDDRIALLVLLEQGIRHADLTGDDHAVGGGEGFAGHAHRPRIDAGLAGFLVNQINDLIRNAVTDLVRMTFGYRFAGEQESRALHCRLHQIEVVENV